MMKSQTVVESLSSADLLSATRELVHASRGVEAELLVHLGEIDERKLYLDFAFPSMFAFCVGELCFSEDAAYNRIMVARAARRFPAIAEAVRSGQVHLAGLRLLAPHLTADNHGAVLAEAAGKSKREIEELVARLWPQPPVPAIVRRIPSTQQPIILSLQGAVLPAAPEAPLASASTSSVAPQPSPVLALVPPAGLPRGDERRAVIAPLAEDAYKVQFTASRACRDKLRQAQALLRHRVPDGDLGTIVEKALDLLIEQVKKERFATGRKGRAAAAQNPACGTDAPNEEADAPPSRHIPDATKRAVFERDAGRCAFVDQRGRRCSETGALEFDHLDGFARTGLHPVDRIRLLCRSHNQHAAEKMYGRAFMERARATVEGPRTRPGASLKN